MKFFKKEKMLKFFEKFLKKIFISSHSRVYAVWQCIDSANATSAMLHSNASDSWHHMIAKFKTATQNQKMLQKSKKKSIIYQKIDSKSISSVFTAVGVRDKKSPQIVYKK